MQESFNIMIAAGGLAVLLANLAYTVWVNWTRASRQELQERDQRHYLHADKLAAMDKRISVLEEAFKHLPTQQDMTSLRGEVHTLAAVVKGVDGRMVGVGAALDRIQGYLMRDHKGGSA